ncbi:hypothetical protein [Sphingomonas sp. RS2018]
MTKPARPPAKRSASRLDERACEMIFPVSAGLIGVCLTAIGIIQVIVRPHHRSTLADDLLSVDAVLFLVAMLASYLALRVQSEVRLHRIERIADLAFIVGMGLLTTACFVLTYWMHP